MNIEHVNDLIIVNGLARRALLRYFCLGLVLRRLGFPNDY